MDLDINNTILFEHLLAYARFSIKDFAKMLKVSKSTIIKRINYLDFMMKMEMQKKVVKH